MLRQVQSPFSSKHMPEVPGPVTTAHLFQPFFQIQDISGFNTIPISRVLTFCHK